MMVSFTKLMIVSCLSCSTLLSTPYVAEAQPRQSEKTVQEVNTPEVLYRDFLLNLMGLPILWWNRQEPFTAKVYKNSSL
jgi:hypothetical protein